MFGYIPPFSRQNFESFRVFTCEKAVKCASYASFAIGAWFVVDHVAFEEPQPVVTESKEIEFKPDTADNHLKASAIAGGIGTILIGVNAFRRKLEEVDLETTFCEEEEQLTEQCSQLVTEIEDHLSQQHPEL